MCDDTEYQLLEKKQKRLELEKLEGEIKDLKSNRKRGWLVSISIIIGVMGTAFSAAKTLSEMSLAYKEQAFKSRLETTELFLKQILPAIKSDDSSSDQAARNGAYLLSISLASEFPDLSAPIYAVLKSNSENGDTDAKEALNKAKLIKEE